MKAQRAQSLQRFFCANMLFSFKAFLERSLINYFFFFSLEYKVSKFLALLLKATLQLKIPVLSFALVQYENELITCFSSVIFLDCFCP